MVSHKSFWMTEKKKNPMLQCSPIIPLCSPAIFSEYIELSLFSSTLGSFSMLEWIPSSLIHSVLQHTHTHTHAEIILNFQISYQRWRFSDSHIQQLLLWISSHPAAFPLHNLYFLSSSSHNFNHIFDLAPCLVLYSSRERWMAGWIVVFIIDIQKYLRYNENVQMKTKEHVTLYYNHKAIIIYQH